jgi:CD109 antigen
LTTALKPYEGIADLYIIDPDGYMIRKWNSKELNVGVLLESFTLPLYPKVGFWKIRVHAEGQIEEMSVKVEKFYLPQAYELVTVMPSFVLDTDEVIEAAVEGYGNTGCGVSELDRFFGKKGNFCC